MRSYLNRIARLNPVYNALVSLRSGEKCMAEARRADEELEAGLYRGWMHGMPHAVKDVANAAGLPTSYGSEIFAGQVAESDDPHVARMRKAGAIFIGKTNTPEWGLGGQTYNAVFGTTVNARDPALTAGGSSGGAACALATRMLPVADGSDMMGSLRTPAAFNNVIGFRPSLGRVPTEPVENKPDPGLTTFGPMGRNVEDTIRLLLTMAGDGGASHGSLPEPGAFRPRVLRGIRLGWMGDFGGYLATEPGVIDLCESALACITDQGGEVADFLPRFDMDRLWRCWLTLRPLGLHPGEELYADPHKRALMNPDFRWEVEQGLDVPPSRLAEAGATRLEWRDSLDAMLDSRDLLALPAAQLFPFDATVHWPRSVGGRSMDSYHRWLEVSIGASLAGFPVVTLPAGFDEHGRPMGIQFMGRMGEDRKVLEFALAWEAATGFLQYSV